MSYKHNYKSTMNALERSIIDSEVMELVEGKVVAMIDPLVFDPEVMAIVGTYKEGKPLMKVVIPSELIDEESVQIIDNLVVVWMDNAIEFNPATMEKVTWGKDLETVKIDDEVKRIYPIDMVGREIRNNPHQSRKQHENVGITIKEDRTLKDLYLSCTVMESVNLVLKGDLMGPLTMKKGSHVVVKGDGLRTHHKRWR